jgi:hypothetical protein
MTAPTIRSIAAAALQAAYPGAPAAAIDAALDRLALVAIGGDLAAAGHAVTTAEQLPATPAAKPAAGEALVEVVDAYQRDFEDSGRVLIVTILPVEPSGERIKVRFDQASGARRYAALRALGTHDDAEAAELVGLRGRVILSSFVGRDGVDRLGVARWVAPPNDAGDQPAKAKPPKGERPKQAKQAAPTHVLENDIPF